MRTQSKKAKGKMEAKDFAKSVIEKFGTSDVFEIAERAGVKIVYESWYPTTIGEFERDTNTILVNRRALENNKNAADLEKIIIAHELGHFFAGEILKSEKANFDEEQFAKEFARELAKREVEID